VQCVPQQMHELRPFPVSDHHKVLQTAFWLGVKWAPVGRGAVTGTGTRARVSQLKLRGKATEPAQNPLKQIMIEVFKHSKGASLFQSGCQGIQAVVVDHVTGAFSRSARHQQTCNHASKQALVACWSLEVRERASNGQTISWARSCRWCCGIQVACSIYQGYTSRFPGYISKATMLLVSESGAGRKK
jgi:hypothetical protein